jgi:hypothetical protein
MLITLAAGALLATSATVAVGSEYLYYSSTGISAGIGRVAVDGTGNNPAFIPGGAGYLAASATNLYWAVPPASGPSYVGRAAIDGTGVDTAWLNQGGANSPAVAINSKYVFYGVNISGVNYIGRANIDGSGINPTFVSLNGLQSASVIAADESQVYWGSGGGATRISRVAVDGTGVNADFVTGTNGVNGLAVTPTHLYWSDTGGSSIGRASIDGSAANPSFISGLSSNVRGVAVSGNKIFWADRANGSLGVANVDGSGVNQSLVTGLGNGLYGVATQYAGGGATLTVTRAGAGTGTVTSSAAGIDCGVTCSAEFPLGAAVTLTAKAASDSVFTGWSGACSGTSATCAVTMSEARGATATFFRASDLRATVLPSRRTLVSGQSMRIGIRARNGAATAATSVTSCLRLPANLVITRASGALRSGRTLCFRIGDIRAGEQVTRSITVRAAAPRRVVRAIGGSDRLSGGPLVDAPAVRVVIRPRLARARVVG